MQDYDMYRFTTYITYFKIYMHVSYMGTKVVHYIPAEHYHQLILMHINKQSILSYYQTGSKTMICMSATK